MRLALLLLMSIIVVGGCSSVHSGGDQPLTIGFWVGADQAKHQLVHDVLRDHGVPATLDQAGVHVEDQDSTKARNVLLHDERLRGSGLMLMVIAFAGTGHATAEGYEVAILAPEDSSDGPSTAAPAGE
jgi:hypothetical protein